MVPLLNRMQPPFLEMSSFTNTDGDNAAISLNNESNSFGGSIALATDSGSAVTLTDTTAIELPALTVAT